MNLVFREKEGKGRVPYLIQKSLRVRARQYTSPTCAVTRIDKEFYKLEDAVTGKFVGWARCSSKFHDVKHNFFAFTDPFVMCHYIANERKKTYRGGSSQTGWVFTIYAPGEVDKKVGETHGTILSETRNPVPA